MIKKKPELKSKQETKYCFECGTKIVRSAKYCENCGTKQTFVDSATTQNEPIAPRQPHPEPDYSTRSHEIRIDVDKFKEILIHSWHLLPYDKQAELASIGIDPKRKFINNSG
ncbi:zinc-ribbon domain-containing protein [Candidatus Woesearchaeota archaeon]|nr:zinc-ribbon domain-containing protein [Candidatus Woesearchaeota archaeon]